MTSGCTGRAACFQTASLDPAAADRKRVHRDEGPRPGENRSDEEWLG